MMVMLLWGGDINVDKGMDQMALVIVRNINVTNKKIKHCCLAESNPICMGICKP